MLKALDFYRTHLSRGLTPEKEVIFMPPNMVRKLDAVGVGNHTYLSITFGSFQEVVRYDHVKKNQINVIRDVRSSGRKTFPCGACVSFEWFAESLVEFHKQEFDDEVSV